MECLEFLQTLFSKCKYYFGCTDLIHWSIRSFSIPPRAIPRAFELLNIGSFKFPSPRAKVVFKCPTQYWTILSVINKCCKIKGSSSEVTYQFLVLLLGFLLLIIIPGWEICLLKPFIHIFSSIIHQNLKITFKSNIFLSKNEAKNIRISSFYEPCVVDSP